MATLSKGIEPKNEDKSNLEKNIVRQTVETIMEIKPTKKQEHGKK